MLRAEGEEYEAALATAAPDHQDEPVGPDDLCLIMYTSGTTGRPKGAMLTHGNMTWNCLNVLVDVDVSTDEVTLVSAPLFHIAALGMTCLPTLLKGGTVVLESAFDTGARAELVARHRITCLFGVPAMYEMLADEPGWDQGGPVEPAAICCAAARRSRPARSGATWTGAGVHPGLRHDRGRARASCCWTAATSDEHAGSAGVPQFFTDVRLVTADGEPAGVGEPGEVLVSGPNVTPGYWQLGPRTPEPAFRDGSWFRSGDVATVDDGGYIRLVDRLKDMIISGGENIYPAEVEDALLEHPDVAECAVFGVPDERWGEVGRAVVVLEGRGASRDGCRALAPISTAAWPATRSPRPSSSPNRCPAAAPASCSRAPLREAYGRGADPDCQTPASQPPVKGSDPHAPHRDRHRRTPRPRRRRAGQ